MDQDKLLIKKLMDKKNISYNRNILTHTKFLNPSELSLCLEYLNHEQNFVATGGIEDSERKIIAFLPDYEIDLPIVTLKITHKQKVSHRDILGSLMGIGINREMLGDIIAGDSESFVFVLEDIVQYVLQNLDKIGRQNITVKIAKPESITKSEDFEIIKDTVKSTRFDSVVACGYKLSRTKSAEMVQAGNVFLNNVICKKTDVNINVGDKISIRGHGKVELAEILGKSKKDRQFIEIRKYL